MNKLFTQRILLCLAISCCAGCSSLSLSQHADSYSNYDQQGNYVEGSQTSDDIPYAIGKYLNQAKVARNTRTEAQPRNIHPDEQSNTEVLDAQ